MQSLFLYKKYVTEHTKVIIINGGVFMTELGCKVKNCLHHSTDNLCCRDTIKVDGCNAKDCCSTCCASYEKTGRVKTENKTMEGHVSLDVCCEATNCKYNENNNCIAKHINVKPSKNKDFGSTECASFELR